MQNVLIMFSPQWKSGVKLILDKPVLKNLSTQKDHGHVERNVPQASSCPVWKCNYISVSIWGSTARSGMPNTSLSSAKLALGCVMSELLDLPSAGMISLFFPYSFHPSSTCQLLYHYCSVRWVLSPYRAMLKPCSSFPVAACHLCTPHSITSSLSCLFISHFPFIFQGVFLSWAKRAKLMTYIHWTIAVLCSSWFLVSLSALVYFLLFSLHSPFSSCLLNLILCYFLVQWWVSPHFEVA